MAYSATPTPSPRSLYPGFTGSLHSQTPSIYHTVPIDLVKILAMPLTLIQYYDADVIKDSIKLCSLQGIRTCNNVKKRRFDAK